MFCFSLSLSRSLFSEMCLLSWRTCIFQCLEDPRKALMYNRCSVLLVLAGRLLAFSSRPGFGSDPSHLFYFQIKKTSEATLTTIQDMVTIEDYDVSECFHHSRSTESVRSTVSETYLSKPSIAKRRANQQETEQFYFMVREGLNLKDCRGIQIKHNLNPSLWFLNEKLLALLSDCFSALKSVSKLMWESVETCFNQHMQVWALISRIKLLSDYLIGRLRMRSSSLLVILFYKVSCSSLPVWRWTCSDKRPSACLLPLAF